MPSRRGLIFALLTLAFVGAALRWPLTTHLVGNDTYLIQGMAGEIESTGTIPWLLSPLSALGLYPFSYSTGGPVLLAETSLISSFPIEASVLLISQIFGLLSVLSAFLLAWRLSRRISVALLGGFFVLLSPSVLWLTTFTFSPRVAVMALGPLLIVLTVDIWTSGGLRGSAQTTKFVCLLLVALGLLVLHRAGILFVGIALLAALVACVLRLGERVRHARLWRRFPSREVILISALLIFLLPHLGVGILSRPSGGNPWADPERIVVSLWATVENYAVVAGPLAILAGYGLLRVLRARPGNRPDVLLLGIILVAAAFASDLAYGFVLLLPLLIWLGATGARRLLDHPWGALRSRARPILVLLLGAAAIVAGYAQLHVSPEARQGGPALPAETFNAAVYLDAWGIRGIATNDPTTLHRWLNGFLGAAVFPFDSVMVFDSPAAVGLIVVKRAEFKLFPLRPSLGPESLFYTAVSPALYLDDQRLHASPLGSSVFESVAARYELGYYLVRDAPGVDLRPPSTLQSDVEAQTYAIYRGASEVLYAW